MQWLKKNYIKSRVVRSNKERFGTMQQVWISVIIACFLFYEGFNDLFTKKIFILPCFSLFIFGIAYMGFQGVNWKFWIYGVFFSIVVCIFSIISSGQIGLGDGLILLALSPFLGKRVISIFFSALFLCAMVGIIIFLYKGINRKMRLPLVPFMMAAYFLENLLKMRY